jgi:hypothetical protein
MNWNSFVFQNAIQFLLCCKILGLFLSRFYYLSNLIPISSNVIPMFIPVLFLVFYKAWVDKDIHFFLVPVQPSNCKRPKREEKKEASWLGGNDLVVCNNELQLHYQGSTLVTYHVNPPTSPSHYHCKWVKLQSQPVLALITNTELILS